MMALVYCATLLLYKIWVLNRKPADSSELSKLLWNVYFTLGCCAVFIEATGVLKTVFEPNYASALFLALCVLTNVSGFLSFRAKSIHGMVLSLKRQKLIEVLLIGSQIYAIFFYLPFAVSSLTGDVNLNRLELADKMELLGSYGLLNTVAGAASQLFGASLILAFVRLSQPARKGHSVTLALLLCFSSFSYVIYILAYVGRDGIIYWLMTAFAVYFVFRSHVAAHLRMQIIQAGLFVAILLMIPLFAITKARFIDSDYGIMWSLLDYFGSQLNTFSDYSSIDRPLTYGASNFPMFTYMICKATLIQDCVKWEEVKYLVFDQYLAQGKEPWLFGTYVSDFVGDFGYIGTLILLSSFSSICYRVCNKNNGKKSINIGQLFLIIFLFLVPYWGVFYFRFSIANAFILINLIFIIFVALLQRPFFVSVKKVIRNDKSKFLTSQISSNQSKDKH